MRRDPIAVAILLVAPETLPTAGPIDFANVPRTIAKQPKLVGEAEYGLFVFGLKGETRVWAVLDQSRGHGRYDVLYLDLNANGDLTDEGERFIPASGGSAEESTFKIGRFVQPGTPAESPRTHTNFTITWTPTLVGYRMRWDGGEHTMGCYGPDGQTYGRFGRDPKSALILVPGHDLPFQFETWLSSELSASSENQFKVFVGNQGSRTGGFSCVDDQFLKKDEFVIATLLYKDRQGKQQSVRYELRERC